MKEERSLPRTGKGGTEHIYPRSEPVRGEGLELQKAEEGVYLECSGNCKDISVAGSDQAKER